MNPHFRNNILMIKITILMGHQTKGTVYVLGRVRGRGKGNEEGTRGEEDHSVLHIHVWK
jgi:hypothetical protein